MTITKMCLWTIKYLPLGIRSFRIWINAEDVMSSKSAFNCNVLSFSSKNKKSKIISKTQLFQFSRVVSVLVMIFGGLGVLGNSLAIAVLSRSAQIFYWHHHHRYQHLFSLSMLTLHTNWFKTKCDVCLNCKVTAWASLLTIEWSPQNFVTEWRNHHCITL